MWNCPLTCRKLKAKSCGPYQTAQGLHWRILLGDYQAPLSQSMVHYSPAKRKFSWAYWWNQPVCPSICVAVRLFLYIIVVSVKAVARVLSDI